MRVISLMDNLGGFFCERENSEGKKITAESHCDVEAISESRVEPLGVRSFSFSEVQREQPGAPAAAHAQLLTS